VKHSAAFTVARTPSATLQARRSAWLNIAPRRVGLDKEEHAGGNTTRHVLGVAIWPLLQVVAGVELTIGVTTTVLKVEGTLGVEEVTGVGDELSTEDELILSGMVDETDDTISEDGVVLEDEVVLEDGVVLEDCTEFGMAVSL
jgi:hypothetical protein